ncbi:DUF4168 domain-containing protein [Sagittula sp. SSi028]|uniref:DUF4168 domain-containing protein n=1 Tax=Sagittula sp. SSi028 TaxID=3400636 RepID=UPI003AF7C24B
MTIRKTLVSSATIAALFAAPLAPAFAQEADVTPPAGAPQMIEDQAANTEFTDAELVGFVTAAKAVADIRQEYMPQLQQAENEDAAMELQRKAMEEMQSAVDETEDMNLALYNEIGQAMQTDTSVSDRIAKLVADDADLNGEG